MESLAALFVGRPLNILLVAAVLGAAQIALRAAGRQSRALLMASAAWVLYAAWEWLVRIRTPEADIRVDLLLIWPVLAIITAVSVFRALR